MRRWICSCCGCRAQDTALWLLERGLAHAAASDAHSPTVRTTHMELLRRTLAEDFSPACPRLLLEENPRRILEDRAGTVGGYQIPHRPEKHAYPAGQIHGRR